MVSISSEPNNYSDMTKPTLIITKNNVYDLQLNIMDPIYQLIIDTQELYEQYYINDKKIVENLGYFVEHEYFPHENVNQNFLERRSNFHGIHFTGFW